MFNLKKYSQEKYVHRVFIVSLFLKGFNALLEILGGILFLFTGSVTTILSLLIHGELIEDPTDFVATHIQHALPYFSTHGQLYASFYLLSHGIIKIILVISLLRNKLWAYPATIVTLFIFIAYQVYQLTYVYSLGFVLLTLFDVLLVVLTWHEYRVVKSIFKGPPQN
ncbi:MAG: hypothetical protein JWP09_586 [Candidatus Taylorbacteria bacterium]|nr:hypothetical protein [Candidatus Taylorbacteria bacterium]